jgi:hypothetical protein
MTTSTPARVDPDTLGTFWVGDSGTKLTVLRTVAPILIGFAVDFHESVETLDPKDCHGDSHGDGIHLNCARHETRATFTTRQIMTVGRLMDKWSLSGRSLLYWAMAFEPLSPAYFRLDVARDVWEPALALLAQPVPEGTAPTPVVPYAGAVGSRTVRLRTPRMRGEDVRFIEQILYVSGHKDAFDESGGDIYGLHVEQVVRKFQAERGLEPDGIVGPDTWTALLG